MGGWCAKKEKGKHGRASRATGQQPAETRNGCWEECRDQLEQPRPLAHLAQSVNAWLMWPVVIIPGQAVGYQFEPYSSHGGLGATAVDVWLGIAGTPHP